MNKIDVAQKNCFDAIPLLSDESVDCVITDPPYFIDGFCSQWSREHLNQKTPKNGVIKTMPKGMKFDPKQGVELHKYIRKLSELLYLKIKPGSFFLCFSMSRLQHRTAMGIEEAGFEIRDILIWKRSSQPKAMRLNHLINISKNTDEIKERLRLELEHKRTPQPTVMYEAIILAQKPKGNTMIENWKTYQTGLLNIEDHIAGNIVDFIEVPREKKSMKTYHMTPKPLALIEYFVSTFTDKNQLVIDPFMGSGTTALACKNLGRNCVGYEIDKEYYKVILDRLK